MASAAAKRRLISLRRSLGIASTRSSSRSPSVRDTGTSWRQHAPQPLRQEIAWPLSAAETIAFTSPCRAGTISRAGTAASGTVIGCAICRSPTVSLRVAVEVPETSITRNFPMWTWPPRARYKDRIMASVSDIRRTFLEYFRKNGHAVLPSSPLVQRNNPTLMFTTAGMVQFKNIFTGMEQPAVPRASTSQKCVRAGGKHHDLENVGYTARHHTFFEMLGNFSFGDYFKETAIELAWNLITREYGLAKDKLLVTVFHTDDEAAGHWKKIAGLSDDKIIRIPTSDNFWAMGDTGPCGPCSEIFFDHGEGIPGGPPGSPDEDGDRFIEIWNLVFMQFEQQTKETRVPLPKPSIEDRKSV